jgi:preprotein translocase subunit SecY
MKMLNSRKSVYGGTLKMNSTSRFTSIVAASILALASCSALARINQVRVINQANQPVYIHLGGYAGSQKIAPGKWKIFHYPFKVIPPGVSTPIRASLIVATAGGQWVTSPDGVTTLKKPTMELCLDYGSPELLKKTGNRKWTIKQIGGFDKGCKIKSYKQPWAQKSS